MCEALICYGVGITEIAIANGAMTLNCYLDASFIARLPNGETGKVGLKVCMQRLLSLIILAMADAASHGLPCNMSIGGLSVPRSVYFLS